jgi:general secretion pathway protein L
MSALIVVLPAHPVSGATEYEFALTRDGSTVESHGAAQASVLPLPTRAGSEVVAVAPARLLSWHRVELPKGVTARSPRLRSVLEGLLEDQVLDEVESLHFALQPQARTETLLWVATCDRNWLRGALQALEAAGRPVSRIVPEFAPGGSPALHAVGEAENATLIVTSDEGVAVLPLATTALTLLPSVPEDSPCIAEPPVAALAEQVLQHTPVLVQPAQRWVGAAQSAWDLAQFDLSSSGRARAFKRVGTVWADMRSAPQWRPARWGAALLIAINLVGLNAWAWRERSALDGKREAMHRTLTETFPHVKLVVDAPMQMEREVAALRQAAGTVSGRDLEAMLSALASALPPQHAIGALDYVNGELRAKGLTLQPDESRATIAALKSRGYGAVLSGDTLVITFEAQP